MKFAKIHGLLLISVLLISGCVTTKPDQYYWGRYQQLLLNMYVESGSADSSLQILQLNEDIEIAENRGKSVPPGVYAHLGFMYAIEGSVTASNQAFAEEKKRFPESAVFIDGMMERAKKAMEARDVTSTQ